MSKTITTTVCPHCKKPFVQTKEVYDLDLEIGDHVVDHWDCDGDYAKSLSHGGYIITKRGRDIKDNAGNPAYEEGSEIYYTYWGRSAKPSSYDGRILENVRINTRDYKYVLLRKSEKPQV